MSPETPPEQRMTDLLSQLQVLVRGHSFSFGLDEVRALTDELVTCWGRYRQRSSKGYARPLGLPTTAHIVAFPHSRDELQTLFATAYWEDVEHGGCYDAWNATMNLWTRPWPSQWNVPPAHDSTLKGTFHFAWGRPPGLWQIETEEGFTLADLMQELGRLELKAFGRLKHSTMLPEGGSAPG